MDRQLWMTHSIVAADDFKKNPDHTRLTMEQKRVELVLGFYAENRTASGATASAFWDAIEVAKTAGFLDEAIYVHLIDQSMAAEYAEFRQTHRDRLARYMKTLVAPPPPTTNAPRSGA